MKRPDFPIPFAKSFFDAYLVDHFLYKQFTLYNTINQVGPSQTFTLQGVGNVDKEDYVKSLRVEIRFTYFQAVETLFELVFSLEPRDGVIDNENIWYYLSTSNWQANYGMLESVARGKTSFLDRVVVAGKDTEVPFIRYLFYFAIADKSKEIAIQGSLEPIRRMLVTFAKDFVDREEYNAFKHALRLMTLMKTFETIDKSSGKAVKVRDLSNSLTYLKREKDGTLTLRTKPLDTERDLRMTIVCSALISNIIRARAIFFKKSDQEAISTFTDKDIDFALKRNVDWQEFRLSLKRSRNDRSPETP